MLGKGKRDSGSGIGIGVDVWRGPKRHRDLLWKREVENVVEFPNSMFSNLRSSLKDVCSFDDLKVRMRAYLSLGSCKEIFEVMTRVNKVCSLFLSSLIFYLWFCYYYVGLLRKFREREK